jgi:outer membrane protein assembly factor BamD
MMRTPPAAIRLRVARLIAIAILGLTIAPLASGCGGRQNTEQTYTEAAEAAFALAERAFDRRDYELARARFQEVYQEFPYSMYAALAEYRIADCWFEEKLYPRAVEQYRRFIRIHPSHERVPEANFRIALAYVEQMPRDFFVLPPSYERDLSETESAYRALRLFLNEYGDSPFAAEANGLLVRTRERLAAYELYVAEFYLGLDNPRGAAQRADFLVREYPDSIQVPPALFLYARAMIELGDTPEAITTLQRLIESFGTHPLSEQAAEWLEEHGPS